MSRGKVNTVCGEVEPESLGITLPHEHMLVDFRKGLVKQTMGEMSPSPNSLTDLPLVMANLGVIRRFPYSVIDNLLMDNVDQMMSEIDRFKQCGGASICEMSVVGIRCEPYKPESLTKIAVETGVNIVHATGFYCEHFLPDLAKKLSVRDMVDFMTSEIKGAPTSAADPHTVPHGVMYIGCSSPLGTNEKKALEASSIVQKETGPALFLHPGRSKQSPIELLDLLSKYGVDLSRTCVSHVDRTFTVSSEDRKALLELAGRGCYLNHSLFGKECSHYQYDSTFDMISDAQRIDQVKFLIEAGFEKQLLLSHDVVCKNELIAYGGNGYSHLLEHIVPKMESRGIRRSTLETLLIKNPSNLLAFR